MDTQTHIIKLPYLLRNITNTIHPVLINQPIKLIFHLCNPIYINELFYYRNNNNEKLYETKDKLNSFILDNPELCYEEINSGITEKYKKKYYSLCKKQNIKSKREQKIINEKNRIYIIKQSILNEIIHNLNFDKNRGDSHIKNCENKIKGINVYKKPLFLYNIHKLNSNIMLKIKTYIQNMLNITLTEEKNTEKEIEILFIYFVICKILKKIEYYNNYLNCCIDNINKDEFNLNKKYCSFNDIDDRMTKKENTKNYITEYHFRDYDAYAIDNESKCITDGYILSCDKRNKKWHLYPKNNKDDDKKTSEDINNFIKLIKIYEEEGIDLLENQL